MKKFVVVYIDRSVKKSKSVWAKSPAQAQTAIEVLMPNVKIIGVVED